jgi:AcrR family transcriptional regulator
VTVATLLEATAQVLVQDGFDGTSTDAIARRAGVSIGTLYQYFPGKEALVVAVITQHTEHVLAEVDNALTFPKNASLETVVRALVRAGITSHRHNPKLHKVFTEEVPRRGFFAKHMSISPRIQSRIRRVLTQHLPAASAHDIRMAAFVLETCIEALTHKAVVEQPDWLSTGELEQRICHMLLADLSEMDRRKRSQSHCCPITNS